MTSPPPPIDQPPKRSGARTALFVFLGVAGLAVLTCGGAAYWFANSEQGQQLLEAAGSAVEMAEKGQSAPGTDELRAAGCEPAMVLAFGDMAELMGAMLDEEDLDAMYDEVPADMQFITCQLSGGSEAPSCQDIANVFVAAVSPTAAFHVQIQGGGASCEESFSSTGEWLPQE